MKLSNKRFWVGILISLALVIFLLQGTDFHKLAEAFRQANYLYCIPMIVLVILGILIRAYRWQFIMEPLHRASLANLYSSTMIGFMANFVLPARIGEFIRAYLIGRKEHVSKSAAFATIVVERLFDMFTIMLILAAVLFLISRPGSGFENSYGTYLKSAGITLCLIFLALLALLVLLKQKTEATLSFVRALLKPFPQRWGQRVSDVLQSFVSGLGAMTFGRHLFAIIFYSLVMWGVYALGNELVLKAFNLELPYYVPFYLLVVQAVGVAVPSSPGFVGTYHAAVVFGMAALNIPKEISLSFAILAHFLMIVPIILYGIILLWKEHLSLHALEAEAEQDIDNPPLNP